MFLSIQVRAQRLSLSRSHLLWQGVSSVSCPQSSPTRGNNVNRHPFRLILRFHWSSTKLIDWFGAPSKQCWWGTWNSNELFIQVPIQNSTESDDTFPSLHPHEVSFPHLLEKLYDDWELQTNETGTKVWFVCWDWVWWICMWCENLPRFDLCNILCENLWIFEGGFVAMRWRKCSNWEGWGRGKKKISDKEERQNNNNMG